MSGISKFIDEMYDTLTVCSKETLIEMVIKNSRENADLKEKIMYLENAKTRTKQEAKTNFELMLEAISTSSGISVETLTGKRRDRKIVDIRHLIFYCARFSPAIKMQLVDIGRLMGNKDHSTVIHGIRKHRDIVECDKDFEYHIAQIIGNAQVNVPFKLEW